MINFMDYRRQSAEAGVELTPSEAKETIDCLERFEDSIREACEVCPTFYQDMVNKTTEDKLEDIRVMKEQGCKMTLKDYNELQRLVIKICKVKGYDNGNQDF